jgi:hypothetical protein
MGTGGRVKLYEIPIEANEIEATLAETCGELTPEMEGRIAEFLKDGKDKIEAAAMVVISLEMDAAICRGEAERLAKRAQGLENAAKRLKGLMLYAVDEGFGGKIKTAKFTIWGQTSGGTVQFDFAPGGDIYKAAAEASWCIRTRDPELDRKALSDAYKAGLALPGSLVAIETPGTRFLRIK